MTSLVATVKGLAMLGPHSTTAGEHQADGLCGSGHNWKKTRELAGRELILAPGTHHVELHLEAVDLASPEKVRLQYRMDSVDAAWLDADATRTAIYTNIPVGTHAFHVRASGGDGVVWDRIGILYKHHSATLLLQTTWFDLSRQCSSLSLFGVYLIRVRHIIQQTHDGMKNVCGARTYRTRTA